MTDGRVRRALSVAVLGVCVLAAFVVVDWLGFGLMVDRYGHQPERLRDATFPVWEREPVGDHGFLAFYGPDDFASGLAYSHHSTAYLFAMYVLHRVERIASSLDMRTTAAFLQMTGLIAAVVVVVLRRCRTRDFFGVAGLLPLLAIVYLATQPGYWISAGKFNVDNPAHFSMPLLVLAAYQLAYARVRGVWYWSSLIAFALFAQFGAVLLAIFLGVKMLGQRSSREAFLRPSMLLFGAGLVLFLQPILTSRLLGFASTNGGLLFRSGLDGDRTYYTNPISAVLHPFVHRPVALLAVPGVLLLVQLAQAWRSTGQVAFPADHADSTFVQLLFSHYVLSLLLFPQAVSIHPYLYDHLAVTPIVIWVVMNTTSNAGTRLFTFWAFGLAGLTIYNLTQIAQAAHCVDCRFPG